jgi:hypothetical protein
MVNALLPPPPSQPDEVEHWSRAMFSDANAHATLAAMAAMAASSPNTGTSGMLSVERLRSLFSR